MEGCVDRRTGALGYLLLAAKLVRQALNDLLNLAIERIRLTNPIWSATLDFAQVGG